MADGAEKTGGDAKIERRISAKALPQRLVLGVLMEKQPDGDTVNVLVVDVTAVETPSEWALLIGDLVQQLANAYVEQGFDPMALRREIADTLISELEEPTDRIENLGSIVD